MLSTYFTALVGMVTISCCWLAVQRLWQRHFPELNAGDDALAGRSGCHACNCESPQCEREPDRATEPSPPQHSSQRAREAS